MRRSLFLRSGRGDAMLERSRNAPRRLTSPKRIVQIREAHVSDGDSPIRKRGPTVDDSRSFAERTEVASGRAKDLGFPRPLRIDDLDDLDDLDDFGDAVDRA